MDRKTPFGGLISMTSRMPHGAFARLQRILAMKEAPLADDGYHYLANTGHPAEDLSEVRAGLSLRTARRPKVLLVRSATANRADRRRNELPMPDLFGHRETASVYASMQ